MRHLYVLILASALVSHLACVHQSSFECEISKDCGEGTCEATGFCSFADPSCDTGRRYGEFASARLAKGCVEAQAATAAVAEISPNNVFVGARAVAFVYDLSIQVDEIASGVDSVSVQLPAGFASVAVSDLRVDGNSVAFSDHSSDSLVDVRLEDKVRRDARLQLHFACDTPASADLVGADFSSAVDDSATAEPAQSVAEGDADGDPEDANRWSVSVSDGVPPVTAAIAEISPRDVAIGTTGNLFTYDIELDIREGDSGVDHLTIAVPSGFADPVVQKVLRDGAEVAISDTSNDNNIDIALDERIASSALVSVLFTADAEQEEDAAGEAFRSTVSDSTMPLVATTESSPRSFDSWLVTTSAWPAASQILAEITPNRVAPDGAEVFTYDLLMTVDESNTGVDAITLSMPANLQPTAISSVAIGGSTVAFTDDITGSEVEILLSEKLVASGHVRVVLGAEVVACSNDEHGEVMVAVDDTSSGYAPQPGDEGNADGDAGDGNQWTVTSAGAPRLYWADRTTAKIQGGVDLSCGVDDLVVGLTDPRLLAADLPAGKLYWADVDVGQIWRANLDGSGLEVVVTGLSSPSGVAIDSAGGKLYWTDYGTDKIQRANLDGSTLEDLLVHGPLPYGIELDLDAGKMYWADTTDGLILRADLDGSNAETILSGLSEAADLVIAGGRIYASAHGTGTIIRAKLDGKAKVTVVTGQDQPVGLAFDAIEDRLYWADSGSGTIRSSNANGTDITDMVTGLSDPQGLILGH